MQNTYHIPYMHMQISNMRRFKFIFMHNLPLLNAAFAESPAYKYNSAKLILPQHAIHKCKLKLIKIYSEYLIYNLN